MPGSGLPTGRGTSNALEQDAEIRFEIEVSELIVWLSVDRQQTQTFLSDVKQLRWSDAKLTRLVRVDATSTKLIFLAPVPALCADARGWAASGYARLTPGTTELLRRLTREVGAGDQELGSTERLLARSETPTTRRLARSLSHVKQQVAQLLRAEAASIRGLNAALGFKIEEGPRREPLGRGTTAIGTSFTVSAEMKGETGSQSSSGEECPLPLEIEEGATDTSGCAEKARVGVPEIGCQQGRLPITMVTPASTASVSLLLSDGRLIVSPVIPIPTSLGGPLGYYRQIVRGPSPIPVSLTELDAEGKPVAVIKLRRLVECTKHPVKLVAGGPVAHGSVPHGPSYTITVGRYRYLGQIQKKLSITFGENGRGGSAGFGLIGSPRASFDYATSCSGRPATLIVAVLRSSKDTVFARTAGGLVALREAAIAPATKAGAKIAYEAFTEPPRELIVRNAAGQTILTRTIGRHFIGGCAHGGSGAVGNLG